MTGERVHAANPAPVVHRPPLSRRKGHWRASDRGQRGGVDAGMVAAVLASGGAMLALFPWSDRLRARAQQPGASWRIRAGVVAPVVTAAMLGSGVGVTTRAIVTNLQEPPLPEVSGTTVPVGSDEPVPVVVIGDPANDPAIATFPVPADASAVRFVTYIEDDGTVCSDVSAINGDGGTGEPVGSVSLTRDRTSVLSALPEGQQCDGNASNIAVQQRGLDSFNR